MRELEKQAFELLLKRELAVMGERLEVDEAKPVGIRPVMTLNRNLEYFGFTLSESVMQLMIKSGLDSFNEVSSLIIEILKDLTGMKIVDALIMYPNFPKQVMNMTEAELYFNAIIHYLSYGKLVPNYEIKDIEDLKVDLENLKVIKLGSMNDLDKLFKDTCSSQVAINEYQMELVTWYINFIDNVGSLISDIPNKENKAQITNYIMLYKPELLDSILKLYKTSTDVLRLAVSMSDGDVTLAIKSNFRNFKRAERRCLLQLIDNCGNLVEDMFKNRETWLRLGEKLNPGDYKKYNKALRAFSLLRDNKKPETFYSKVETSFKVGDTNKIAELLKTRPGEFARCLNRLISLAENEEQAMNLAKVYGEVTTEVSNAVLWSVITFFRTRKEDKNRVFYPKGNIAKAFIVENKLKEVSEKVVKYILDTSMRGLIGRYATRETLGKVYIEPDMIGYKIPTVMRDMNESMQTIARGSRVKINTEKKVIRAFTYWKNDDTDVDLSVVALNNDLETVGLCSYYSLINKELGLYHSGDLVDGTRGASEYVDIDLDHCKKSNARYIVIMINSYSCEPFKDMTECFCGIMTRDKVEGTAGKGKVFEPSTVITKTDVSSNSLQATPLVIDLYTMEMVWLDLPLMVNEDTYNNVTNNSDIIRNTLSGMLNHKAPNIKEVVELNVRARMGEIVFNREEADVIVGVSEGSTLTPYQLSELAANWL